MSLEKLVEYLSALDDPWYGSKDEHRLIIAVGAEIAYVRSWDDTTLYSHNKLDWLQSFPTLANESRR